MRSDPDSAQKSRVRNSPAAAAQAVYSRAVMVLYYFLKYSLFIALNSALIDERLKLELMPTP